MIQQQYSRVGRQEDCGDHDIGSEALMKLMSLAFTCPNLPLPPVRNSPWRAFGEASIFTDVCLMPCVVATLMEVVLLWRIAIIVSRRGVVVEKDKS